MSWSAAELPWEDGDWDRAATNKYFTRPATGSFVVPRNEGIRSRLYVKMIVQVSYTKLIGYKFSTISTVKIRQRSRFHSLLSWLQSVNGSWHLCD